MYPQGIQMITEGQGKKFCKAIMTPFKHRGTGGLMKQCEESNLSLINGLLSIQNL